MPDATFACPDLTTFCRLEELGLEVVGQRLEPDRAVLACRVVEPDSWCRRCGCEGVSRDTVVRQLAHEPLGWRPTTLLVTVNGTATLAAAPDAVFAALVDPAVLAATIPGVQALRRLDDDLYSMTVVAGVASIKGSYEGEVAVRDRHEPESFTLHAKGSGAPGTVDATVRVSLDAHGAGTRVSYDADAVVGGMIGGVGQRMLAGVSKRMAAQFFGNVDAVIAGGVPSPAGVPAPASAPAVAGTRGAAEGPQAFTAPAAPRSDSDDMRVPFWVVLAGVGAGAFWALAGVLVGQHVSRRRG